MDEDTGRDTTYYLGYDVHNEVDGADVDGDGSGYDGVDDDDLMHAPLSYLDSSMISEDHHSQQQQQSYPTISHSSAVAAFTTATASDTTAASAASADTSSSTGSGSGSGSVPPHEGTAFWDHYLVGDLTDRRGRDRKRRRGRRRGSGKMLDRLSHVNILVLGVRGSGKSSLISTVRRAVDRRHVEGHVCPQETIMRSQQHIGSHTRRKKGYVVGGYSGGIVMYDTPGLVMGGSGSGGGVDESLIREQREYVRAMRDGLVADDVEICQKPRDQWSVKDWMWNLITGRPEAILDPACLVGSQNNINGSNSSSNISNSNGTDASSRNHRLVKFVQSIMHCVVFVVPASYNRDEKISLSSSSSGGRHKGEEEEHLQVLITRFVPMFTEYGYRPVFAITKSDQSDTKRNDGDDGGDSNEDEVDVFAAAHLYESKRQQVEDMMSVVTGGSSVVNDSGGKEENDRGEEKDNNAGNEDDHAAVVLPVRNYVHRPSIDNGNNDMTTGTSPRDASIDFLATNLLTRCVREAETLVSKFDRHLKPEEQVGDNGEEEEEEEEVVDHSREFEDSKEKQEYITLPLPGEGQQNMADEPQMVKEAPSSPEHQAQQEEEEAPVTSPETNNISDGNQPKATPRGCHIM